MTEKLAELLEGAEKVAMGLPGDALASLTRHLPGVAAGVGLGGLGMHMLNTRTNERTRNRAFGAGLAGGVALPGLLRRGVGAAQTMGLLPPGTVNPEATGMQQGFGGGYG